MQGSLVAPQIYGGCTLFFHYPLFQFLGIYLKNSEEFVIFLFFFRYQFVPQIIFLNSLFGYLSLLIIIKWCTGSQADLYHVMIYMFLSPTDDLGENQLFWGQRPLQVFFLLDPSDFFPNANPFRQLASGCRFGLIETLFLLQILLLLSAVVAVPWMLFPKPFILKKLHSEVYWNFTWHMLLVVAVLV